MVEYNRITMELIKGIVEKGYANGKERYNGFLFILNS